MNICGVNYESFADGVGIRTAIFISGCSKNCKGCQNKLAQDKNYGILFTKEIYDTIISEIKKRPFVKGVTFTGGDPFETYNINDTSLLIHNIKCDLPYLNIWVYTGDLYENLFINYYYSLCYVDILVDGRFDINKKDKRLAFRGSSNQRIIDVQKSLKTNEIVLAKDLY